ncbi:hypothetical protein [Sivoneniella epilithica]
MMTNSTSSARGKQLFNSLLTMAGLVVVGVAGVAFYANTKESRGAYGSGHLPLTNHPTQGEISPQITIPNSELTPYVPKANPSLSASGNPGSRWKDSYRTYQIPAYCNGSPSSGANFRQYPTLDSSAILGAVESGQTIWLTGQRIKSDGVVWYESINPMPLAPTTDSTAQNKLKAYQVGWIADCFL